MKKPFFYENKSIKILNSPNYNYMFNKENGFFARWGKTRKDDPSLSPFGPEILDWEIASGRCSMNCKMCYKSNGKGDIKYTPLSLVKETLPKMGKQLTQVAYGITDIDANPDMWDIFKYTREIGLIPNVTINGNKMKPNDYDKLSELCGAVSVSHYDDDMCFNAVKELTDRGMTQVNIHQLIAEETYDECLSIIDSIQNDQRLEKLNAIVFLSLKKKGRGSCMNILSQEKFNNLMKEANGLNIGFDSCSAPKVLNYFKGTKDFEKIKLFSEPCESSLFSAYLNVDAEFFPCSFVENVVKGIDVKKHNSFLEVWEECEEFRNKLLETEKHNICRTCPAFEI